MNLASWEVRKLKKVGPNSALSYSLVASLISEAPPLYYTVLSIVTSSSLNSLVSNIAVEFGAP